MNKHPNYKNYDFLDFLVFFLILYQFVLVINVIAITIINIKATGLVKKGFIDPSDTIRPRLKLESAISPNITPITRGGTGKPYFTK